MKHCLLALLLLFSTFSLAQIAPAKGDNTIEFTATQSVPVIYKTISLTLLDTGYPFKADEASCLFRTEGRALPKQPGLEFYALISFRGGKLRVTATLRNTANASNGLTSADNGPIPVEYDTIPMQQAGFSMLDELAHKLVSALEGSVLTYSSQ